MGRIRTIKPEFPQSESIGRLSRDGRLLFVQLWTVVDDSGRTRAASRMLASLLYPYDDDAGRLMSTWLDELQHENLIRCYVVDGSSYLEILNWLKHQKIDHPSQSRLPSFSETSPVTREGSRAFARDPGSLAPDLGPVPVPSTKEQDPGPKEPRAARVVVPDEHELPPWLPQEPWDSFVRMRRKSKEPFTQDAVKLAIAKLGKMADAGQNVAEVLNQSTLNGWKGLFEIKGSASNGKFVNKSQQRANSNIEAAANYIAEIDGREAAADFVRGATGQSERYSLEDLRKPALEAPDRGCAGSGHPPVTIEAPGRGNSIPRSSHA